jgi:hypothetical protein
MIKERTAKIVPANRLMRTLPKYFPGIYLHVEHQIYNTMSMLCPAYRGGFWNFHETSNGGFFMSPDRKDNLLLSVPLNQSEEEVSPEAAGVTVCIFAYSILGESLWTAGRQKSAENLYTQVDRLKDYADRHPEGRKIFRLID